MMMKHTLSILIMAALLSSCGNSEQTKAVGEAKQVQSAIKAMRPGTIATKENGWSMKAKINGKQWTAASMMPPDAAGRIIGYYNDEYIGLPYDRRSLVVGKRITFGENNAVDLATNDDVGMWGGRKGEMEITKVDDNWAEGKFFFTGSTSTSPKTVDVSDGSFRISLEKNPR
jgi:hypothetical protein